MSINFDENWLNWAVQIEDEADCDISNYGQNLGKYLEVTGILEASDNVRT